MCLENINLEKTKELKSSKEKIIGYKLLEPNDKSIFRHFQWKLGENISSRKSAELTETEVKDQEIHQGFHFFLEKPETCPYQDPNLCQCHYQNRNRYLYYCTDKDPLNELVEFEINPKDIIALGTWENINSFVATKATLIEKIKV